MPFALGTLLALLVEGRLPRHRSKFSCAPRWPTSPFRLVARQERAQMRGRDADTVVIRRR